MSLNMQAVYKPNNDVMGFIGSTQEEFDAITTSSGERAIMRLNLMSKHGTVLAQKDVDIETFDELFCLEFDEEDVELNSACVISFKDPIETELINTLPALKEE